MDESVNNGMRLLEVKGCDAAIPKNIKTGRICVQGYDTSLPRDDVESTLRKLLDSCGEITDVFICKIYVNLISRYALIYFARVESVEKALELNGKDVGGWIAKVEAYPVSELASQCPILKVQGYDTSLSDEVIKNALRKHFSSCGSVFRVRVIKSMGIAGVYISGEEAAEKALEISEFYIEGRKVVATLASTPINPTHHRLVLSHLGCYGPPGHLGPPGKKAKMSTDGVES